MFSPYQTSGFYYTPVSKALLSILVLVSVAFNVPLSAYRRWFSVTYSSLFQHLQFDRFLACRCMFLDPKDVVCGCILIYQFRIFERRYGSTKFMSYVFGSWCLSLLLELLFLFLFHIVDVRLSAMPTGPWGVVFAMFIPYFTDIPRVAVTHVWGIPVTGKSLTYIIGLQMMSSSVECIILAACGLLSGMIYKNDLLLIQSWLKVPRYLGQLTNLTIGHLFQTPPPRDLNAPMGATLELQRLNRIEELEQQTAWAQLNLFNNQRQQNRQGFGLFQRADRAQTNQISDADIEVNVNSLIDMGFSRDRAEAALRRSGNSLEMATNLLLAQAS